MADQTLQVKIEGDLKNLQSALNQGKKDLKSFGDNADIAGEQLESSFNSAVPAVNRLNIAEKQLANTTQNLRGSIGGANGVAIEFSRIIQDAPFGIIGVGNNITQLTQSFASLKTQSGSTGAAIKASLAALVTPANLLVIGISAVTTAFTLYSLSARGAEGPINDLKKAQDDFNDSLKETDRLLGSEVYSQFLKEVGLIERQNIGGKLIDVPTFTSASEVVDKLAGKIETLRKGELDLLAKFFKTEISEATRSAASSTEVFVKQLADEKIATYNGLLEKVNAQLSFYGKDSAPKAASSAKLALDAFTDTKWQEAIDLQERLSRAFNQLTANDDPITELSNRITRDLVKSGLPVIEVADIVTPFENQSNRINEIIGELGGAFTGLGGLIGKAFNNQGLGSFVGEFLRFAAKLVAANFTIATSSAIAGASSSAAATGPGAIFTLPAFIAGAVGLVASAFSAIGGGGGGGGGGISSSSGSSFGNVGAQGISTPAFSSIPVNSDFQQNVIVYGRLD